MFVIGFRKLDERHWVQLNFIWFLLLLLQITVVSSSIFPFFLQLFIDLSELLILIEIFRINSQVWMIPPIFFFLHCLRCSLLMICQLRRLLQFCSVFNATVKLYKHGLGKIPSPILEGNIVRNTDTWKQTQTCQNNN